MNKIRKIITWFKIKFGRKPRIVEVELLEDLGEEPRLILHKTDGRWKRQKIKNQIMYVCILLNTISILILALKQ